MKIPFKIGGDAIAAVQAAKAAAEEKIGSLELERQARLYADDWTPDDAVRNDRERATLRASIAAYDERLIALQRRQHDEDIARRQREKTAGIADVKKRLNKRLEAARKLDAAKAQVTQAFEEYIKAEEEAFDNLPPSVSPLGGLAHFRMEAFEPLSPRRLRRPPSAGLARCFAEHESFDFAGDIEIRNREVIEMLENVSIDESTEEAA